MRPESRRSPQSSGAGGDGGPFMVYFSGFRMVLERHGGCRVRPEVADGGGPVGKGGTTCTTLQSASNSWCRFSLPCVSLSLRKRQRQPVLQASRLTRARPPRQGPAPAMYAKKSCATSSGRMPWRASDRSTRPMSVSASSISTGMERTRRLSRCATRPPAGRQDVRYQCSIWAGAKSAASATSWGIRSRRCLQPRMAGTICR